MYEHVIPSFVAFAARTSTMAELLLAALQCVSIRLLITNPMATTAARVKAQSNSQGQY